MTAVASVTPSEALRPQDLTLTLLGDYVAPSPHPIWSGGLVALLAGFGFSPDSARVALSRLGFCARPASREAMSAEATRYVWERPRLCSTRLMLALAHLSADRTAPFRISAGAGALAKMLDISERRVKSSIADLVSAGVLKIEKKGGGNASSCYSFC